MTELAREYGEGMYILARDEALSDRIGEELRQIREIFEAQPDYIRLLGSRAVELEQRLQIVEDTFAGRAHPYVVNFMKLLVRRGSINAFADCAKWFSDRYNEDNGIAEAYVTSAVELDEERAAALKEKLGQMTGKNVVLISRVDPALIGGLCVEINGRKYDNSIRNRLDRLKTNLTGV